MSIASQWHRLRNPRILAIPLTRSVPNPPSATNPDAKLDSKMLTFYQFRLNGHRKPVLRFLLQEGVDNWLKEKTASVWARFGKAEGWRVCFILFLPCLAQMDRAYTIIVKLGKSILIILILV